MIRVVYRWQVDLEKRPQFVAAWRAATERIRSEEPGAMGSTLLEPTDDAGFLVGLARWRSRADVEAFWARGSATPLPAATLASVEVLDELVHLTDEASAP